MTAVIKDADVRVAVEAYGLCDAKTEYLVTSFNTLYRVTAQEGTFVLRVGPTHRIHRADAAEAEAELTTAARAAGIAAPEVIRTPHGRAAVVVDGREHMLLSWVEGTAVPEPSSARDAADLGTLAARMHALPAVPRSSGALDADRLVLFEPDERLGELTGRYGALFTDAADRARAAIGRLRGPRLLLHGDLTLKNVVRGPSGLVPLDFQDLMWGRVEQDLAHSVFGLRADPELLNAFRGGYERVRPMPDIDPALFVARRLQMVNLALVLRRDGLEDYLARHADALRAEAAEGVRGMP